jgi:hypothetical protein
MIVTPNFTLRDSLRMVISALTDADIATVRDCAGARAALLAQPVDAALIDGHLPLDELRGLTQELATLAPGMRYAVLLDDRAADRHAQLAGEAEVLSIYTQPAGDFFHALADFIGRATSGSPAER